MRPPLLAFALAAALAACGPGSKNPEPPPDGGSGSGGDTSSGGGQPSGGGQSSQPSGGDPSSGGGQPSGAEPSGGGGQPSGGGTGDGGAPSGGGGSGGSGAPPDSGAPVRSPDGTVAIVRVDASAECDGLLPSSAPSAVVARVAGADPAYCGAGVSEGHGHVAVRTSIGPPGKIGMLVLSPDGAPERTIESTWNTSGTPRPRPFAFPQQDGWVAASAIDWGRPMVQVDVGGLLPDGTPRAAPTRVTPVAGQSLSWTVTEDPRGGAVFAATRNPPAGPDCAGAVVRFDALGAPRGPAAAFGHGSTCAVVGVAVSRAGETLVVEATGPAPQTAWLHWIRADGTAALPPVNAGPLAGVFASDKPVFLAPLLDDSIVASEDGVWTRRFPHLADHAEAAPGWLDKRPRFTFRNTRGNRGYALFPPGGDSADCTQRIEVVAPSGRLCGTVTLSDPGGACTTREVDQGWDGTVVQQAAREPCAWRWWPRLLGE